MTADELKAIEAHLQDYLDKTYYDEDSAFIYAEDFERDIPALIAEVRRLRKRYETPATSGELDVDVSKLTTDTGIR